MLVVESYGFGVTLHGGCGGQTNLEGRAIPPTRRKIEARG